MQDNTISEELINVTEQEIKRAKLPHDLFLLNLIGNHILTFVATLGLATSWLWPVFIVPVISFIILGIIIVKGKAIIKNDSETEFVKSHWQIAVKRSLVFIKMLLLLSVVTCFGIYGYLGLGWMKELVFAIIGGTSILPIMVTTLILIIMESESLHIAGKGEVHKK